jgi:hypothetical protein
MVYDVMLTYIGNREAGASHGNQRADEQKGTDDAETSE